MDVAPWEAQGEGHPAGLPCQGTLTSYTESHEFEIKHCCICRLFPDKVKVTAASHEVINSPPTKTACKFNVHTITQMTALVAPGSIIEPSYYCSKTIQRITQ